jgi:rhamnosyltransferase
MDYVALSDQDDIWLPDKLHHAVKMLSGSGAGGYSCSVIARWPDGREVVFRQSEHLRDADHLFEGAGQGCTFVLTRALFENVQSVFRTCPDLTARLIYHDWAIYALARVRGIAWAFDSEPFIVYRQHADNDTGARHSLDGIQRRMRLLTNGRYARQVLTICQMCFKVAPEDRLVRRWLELDSFASPVKQRVGKALFCARYGRRRFGDRMITSAAALAGWL